MKATDAHCPTCTCADRLATDSAWHPYAVTTAGYRECARCGISTYRPGHSRWAWRHQVAKIPGRPYGRAGESWCPNCLRAEGVILQK